MIIKNKKIIIFDLDGVIFNSIGFVREYMKNKYEGMTEKDFKDIFITNFWDGLTSFKEIAKKKYVIHEEYSKNKREDNKNIFIFDGIMDVLMYLSSKYILVINSSDYEKDINERLKFNKIEIFFDCIVGKEFSKNKVEKFNFIIEKYNVSNKDVIFVTDTISDVIESDKSNIDSIAVTWGVHSKSDFKKQKFSNLVFIIDSVDDLKLIF